MGLDKELLDILACPVCKGDVYESEDENFLVCEKCRLKFPVKEGIPVMLPEEALSLDEK
ncbi:MAG: Trm112 family protein [Desulfobacteraceae bacterium]|nr:Trm112 family protein [Desulfobacteraceae bacterium]